MSIVAKGLPITATAELLFQLSQTGHISRQITPLGMNSFTEMNIVFSNYARWTEPTWQDV